MDEPKKQEIVLKNRPLDNWIDECPTGSVGYMLKRPIGLLDDPKIQDILFEKRPLDHWMTQKKWDIILKNRAVHNRLAGGTIIQKVNFH